MCEILAVFTFLLCFSYSEQAIKEWTPDLSFNNSLNWTPRRMPCSRDRVVYPRDMMYELQLGGAESRVWVAALQLPRDGGLLLPTDGEIRLGGSPSGEKCPGEEMHFTNNIIRFWDDPANWRTRDEEGQKQLPGEGGPAVTHLERLPCSGDTVNFPALHGLVVQLPSELCIVRNISINHRSLGLLRWLNLIQSMPLTFIRALEGAPPPLMHRYRYFNRMCQRFRKTRICSLVKCPPPRCLQPVEPENHCCKICGAVIILPNSTVSYDGQQMRRVRELVSTRVAQGGRGVRWWVGPSPSGLQVVLVDADAYEGASSDIAPSIKEELDSHSEELQLTLGKSSLALSGLPWQGMDAMQGGWEALVMLAAVLASLAAVLMYYYTPTGVRRTFTQFSIPSPFDRNFARFDNRSREGSLVLGISQLSLDKAFDNPMYAAAARHQPEVEKKADTGEEYEVNESNPEEPDTEEEDLLEETTFQE